MSRSILFKCFVQFSFQSYILIYHIYKKILLFPFFFCYDRIFVSFKREYLNCVSMTKTSTVLYLFKQDSYIRVLVFFLYYILYIWNRLSHTYIIILFNISLCCTIVIIIVIIIIVLNVTSCEMIQKKLLLFCIRLELSQGSISCSRN